MNTAPAPAFSCRRGCAACCIAPSISSPIPASAQHPGLPRGKPAGMACPQLDDARRCRLFGQATRPAVCRHLQPSREMCGDVDDGGQQALAWLSRLERITQPHPDPGQRQPA